MRLRETHTGRRRRRSDYVARFAKGRREIPRSFESEDSERLQREVVALVARRRELLAEELKSFVEQVELTTRIRVAPEGGRQVSASHAARRLKWARRLKPRPRIGQSEVVVVREPRTTRRPQT